MTSEGTSLRPVSTEDYSFLLEVYASTRELELAMSGWDKAQQDTFVRMQFDAQQHYYGAAFPDGQHNIILVDGQPTGRIYTTEDEEQIKILDITLLPSRRNAGVGTPLIKEVLERAQAVGKRVQIYVESYNPSRRLFERLGFSIIGDDGLNLLFEWRPSA